MLEKLAYDWLLGVQERAQTILIGPWLSGAATIAASADWYRPSACRFASFRATWAIEDQRKHRLGLIKDWGRQNVFSVTTVTPLHLLRADMARAQNLVAKQNYLHTDCVTQMPWKLRLSKESDLDQLICRLEVQRYYEWWRFIGIFSSPDSEAIRRW